MRDSQERAGEATLAVTSGKLSKVVISPVSPIIRKGSNTITLLHLQDRLGNPISPDLNRVIVNVSGGYFSDANGQKLTTMSIDAMESDIPLLIGSDTV